MDNIKAPFVPELKTFCGCIDLRYGAMLFGWISLFGSLYMCLEIFATIISISVNPHYVEDEAGILVFGFLVHSVHIGTSCSLLYGVYRRKNKPMFGWLLSTVLVAVLEALVLPSLYIRILLFQKLLGIDYRLIIVTIIMLIDDVYGWLVVYGYYRSLAPPSLDYVLNFHTPSTPERETL